MKNLLDTNLAGLILNFLMLPDLNSMAQNVLFHESFDRFSAEGVIHHS